MQTLTKRSSTNYTYHLREDIYEMYVDLEFTKDGLVIDSSEEATLPWSALSAARRECGLQEWTDEEFAAYAAENGYYKFVPPKPNGDAMTDPARAIADLLSRLDTQRMDVLSMLMIWARDCVLPDRARMEQWAAENGYVKPEPDEQELPTCAHCDKVLEPWSTSTDLLAAMGKFFCNDFCITGYLANHHDDLDKEMARSLPPAPLPAGAEEDGQ